MLELGIVVALALAIWLAVAKPVNFSGFVAKAGTAADEVTGGIKEGHKKMLGKVVKLGVAALAIAFILFYDWQGTAVGKRLADFLGTENADLFTGAILLTVALLLYKSLGGITGTKLISWVIVAMLLFMAYDGLFNSEERPLSNNAQQERLARELQETEIKVAKAAANAAAQTAARIAAEQAQEKSLKKVAEGACTRRYADQLNCVTVVFGPYTVYEREAKEDHCIVSDPVSALKRTHLGGHQYRFVGRTGLTAQFFDLPVGQSVGSFKCGG